MSNINHWDLVVIACVTWFLYLGALVIYRLSFHPLRSFPGPRLAAVTWLYKAYYVLVKGGEMLHNVERLHKTYGELCEHTSGDETRLTYFQALWLELGQMR